MCSINIFNTTIITAFIDKPVCWTLHTNTFATSFCAVNQNVFIFRIIWKQERSCSFVIYPICLNRRIVAIYWLDNHFRPGFCIIFRRVIITHIHAFAKKISNLSHYVILVSVINLSPSWATITCKKLVKISTNVGILHCVIHNFFG